MITAMLTPSSAGFTCRSLAVQQSMSHHAQSRVSIVRSTLRMRLLPQAGRSANLRQPHVVTAGAKIACQPEARVALWTCTSCIRLHHTCDVLG